jgi:hypothetical protein
MTEAWSYFYKASDFQIVGDDLTVTNPVRTKKAIDLKSCNALLLITGLVLSPSLSKLPRTPSPPAGVSWFLTDQAKPRM